MNRFAWLQVFTVILAIVWAGSIAAGEKGPCADPQTQAEINECAAGEFRQADAEINKVYQELMSKLDEERSVQLREAQSAWIRFRDAHCRFVNAELAGKSMYPTLQYGCLTSVSRARTEQLRETLEDLSNR